VANVIRVVHRLRDVEAWGTIIELLDIRDKKDGQPMSEKFAATADTAHCQAMALFKRGESLGGDKGDADEERAIALINEVCLKFPKSCLAQGLKGKAFKTRFSKYLQATVQPTHAVIEAYYRGALDTYVCHLPRPVERPGLFRVPTPTLTAHYCY
jgi:hypothetical protein